MGGKIIAIPEGFPPEMRFPVAPEFKAHASAYTDQDATIAYQTARYLLCDTWRDVQGNEKAQYLYDAPPPEIKESWMF